MENTRRHGAKIEFQSHGLLRISHCLGASMAVQGIEASPERLLARFRAGKA